MKAFYLFSGLTSFDEAVMIAVDQCFDQSVGLAHLHLDLPSFHPLTLDSAPECLAAHWPDGCRWSVWRRTDLICRSVWRRTDLMGVAGVSGGGCSEMPVFSCSLLIMSRTKEALRSWFLSTADAGRKWDVGLTAGRKKPTAHRAWSHGLARATANFAFSLQLELMNIFLQVYSKFHKTFWKVYVIIILSLECLDGICSYHTCWFFLGSPRRVFFGRWSVQQQLDLRF